MNFERLKKYRGFATGILTASVLFLFVRAKNADSYFEISKNLDIFTNIFKELNTYYVDPIEPGKLVKTGVDAMLENLDPYTNYYTESDIEEYEFQTTGKYGGIGANMRKKEGLILVGEVHEGGPAHKAGLHPGDQIMSIDNQPLKGKNLDDISILLKGAPGTQVTLKVKDYNLGSESSKIITRGEIEVSSVPYYSLIGSNKDIAFVKLTQFTPGCSRLVKNALDSLKSARPELAGVVLDLRNNPGGLLDEAVNICNLFIDQGQLVVSTKGKVKEWDKDFATQGRPWDTKVPVFILINRSSASASEIVSGTLQDLDRGVVIGERSYGKGLVQVTQSLGYNARLKITTAKYYTPSGRCIQALDYTNRNPDGSVGVIPDSLKQEFKTKHGRKVLSGGGVEPDLEVPDDEISKLAITLYVKNYFFDYANHYAKQHPKIDPANNFALSKEGFNDFSKWLGDKDYSYKSETEIVLDSLQSIAGREKYFDAIQADFKAMQTKVSHDKAQDLIKHQDEITRLLENEIVSRYYYLHGRIANSLKHDKDVEKAFELLARPEKYNALLQPKK